MFLRSTFFFSVKVKGRVKGRMKELSTCCGHAQANHQLKRTARPSSSPTEVADKAPATTMAATVSAISKQTVGVSGPLAQPAMRGTARITLAQKRRMHALPGVARQRRACPKDRLSMNNRCDGRNTGPMREISETTNMSRLPSSSTESSDVPRRDAALQAALQGAIRQRERAADRRA